MPAIMLSTPSLILASSSRYRRELLNRLGLPFTCERPDVDESAREGETPLQLAERLAYAKAADVAEKHPWAYVIGSDQVCDLNGRALGKPRTFEGAVAQLEAMQGRAVVFHTAVCVLGPRSFDHRFVSDTVLQMRPLTPIAIEEYVRREEPYDCAGSAKIERLGISLIRSISSDDPTSLIGLPLMRLTDVLMRAGLSPVPGLNPF